MPVALKDVKKGDMLLHNGFVVFVEEIKKRLVVKEANGEMMNIY